MKTAGFVVYIDPVNIFVVNDSHFASLKLSAKLRVLLSDLCVKPYSNAENAEFYAEVAEGTGICSTGQSILLK